MEVNLSMVIWNLINLAILIWIIVHFARKPISTMISNKQERIHKELDELKNKLENINEQLNIRESKLKNIVSEIEKIEENYKKMSGNMTTNIDESAKQETNKLRNQATVLIQQELNQIKADLRKEFSNKAVNSATNMIKDYLDDPKQLQIINNFSTNLDKPHQN